jgi:hypothetical protein
MLCPYHYKKHGNFQWPDGPLISNSPQQSSAAGLTGRRHQETDKLPRSSRLYDNLSRDENGRKRCLFGNQIFGHFFIANK